MSWFTWFSSYIGSRLLGARGLRHSTFDNLSVADQLYVTESVSCDCEAYLQHVPASLQGLTDAILVVEDQKFLVHGMLLAMHSRVLEVALACNGPAEHLLKEVPLEGQSTDSICKVLTYIYRRAHEGPFLQCASRVEAVQVVSFAHQYDAPMLLAEAEIYLGKTLKEAIDSQSNLPLQPAGSSAGRQGAKANYKEPHALADLEAIPCWNLLDMLAFAADTHLSKLEEACMLALLSLPKFLHDNRLQTLEPRLLAQLLQRASIQIKPEVSVATLFQNWALACPPKHSG